MRRFVGLAAFFICTTQHIVDAAGHVLREVLRGVQGRAPPVGHVVQPALRVPRTERIEGGPCALARSWSPPPPVRREDRKLKPGEERALVRTRVTADV